jgi:hypothetical protein
VIGLLQSTYDRIRSMIVVSSPAPDHQRGFSIEQDRRWRSPNNLLFSRRMPSSGQLTISPHAAGETASPPHS